jgi:hypothetical protein
VNGTFARPEPGPRGALQLAGATTDAPYTGRHRNQSVMIVGYGTEHERVFTTPERAEARRYAKEHQLGLTRAIASQLPHDIGVSVLGG